MKAYLYSGKSSGVDWWIITHGLIALIFYYPFKFVYFRISVRVVVVSNIYPVCILVKKSGANILTVLVIFYFVVYINCCALLT